MDLWLWSRMAAKSPILPANPTGQQFSKLNDGNGAPAITAVPRFRVLTTVGFSAVHCDPRLKHFVSFGVVPKALVRSDILHC